MRRITVSLVVLLSLCGEVLAGLSPYEKDINHSKSKLNIHYSNYNKGPQYSDDYEVVYIKDLGDTIEFRLKPNQAIYIPKTKEVLAVFCGSLSEVKYGYCSCD